MSESGEGWLERHRERQRVKSDRSASDHTSATTKHISTMSRCAQADSSTSTGKVYKQWKQDGAVSPTKVKEIMRMSNLGGLPPADADKVVAAMDPSGTGQISYSDFKAAAKEAGPNRFNATQVFGYQFADPRTPRAQIQYMSGVLRDQIYDSFDSLQTAFNQFDTNGDGVLSREEFREGLHGMDIGLSDLDIDMVIKEADEDGNGVIDYNEFSELMKPPTARGLPDPRDHTAQGEFHRQKKLGKFYLPPTRIKKPVMKAPSVISTRSARESARDDQMQSQRSTSRSGQSAGWDSSGVGSQRSSSRSPKKAHKDLNAHLNSIMADEERLPESQRLFQLKKIVDIKDQMQNASGMWRVQALEALDQKKTRDSGAWDRQDIGLKRENKSDTALW